MKYKVDRFKIFTKIVNWSSLSSPLLIHTWTNQQHLVISNEHGVPTISYNLAGWFWEILNEIEMFRKGFLEEK